jgi:very-short-patch-repair endonuclease
VVRKHDGTRPKSLPPLDVEIAREAERQGGVISAAQLERLGLGPRGTLHRAAAGRLHRLYPGVYAVGHAVLGPDGRRMAAVLACGPGAVLSHRSAAELWEIRSTARARHEVTAPRGRSEPDGIELHTTRRLYADEITEVRGIPVTTVARTLVDLADHLTLDALATTLHEAEVNRLDDRHAIEAAIARANGRRGIARLRAAMEVPNPGPTRNEFERAFARLCREGGLPTARMNAPISLPDRIITVDALFPDHGVVVELDGAGAHDTRRAFHADRRRDTALAAIGLLPIRLTWHRVTRERARTRDELARILVAREAHAAIPV